MHMNLNDQDQESEALFADCDTFFTEETSGPNENKN